MCRPCSTPMRRLGNCIRWARNRWSPAEGRVLRLVQGLQPGFFTRVTGLRPWLQLCHFDDGFLFVGRVGVRLSRRGRRVPRSGRWSFHDCRGGVVVVRLARGVP
jgi:hypothetical protein